VPAIDEAKRMGAMALNELASPMLHARRGDIIERAAALRLPAICRSVESAEEADSSPMVRAYISYMGSWPGGCPEFSR
jgi:hypothetical protein